MKPTDLALTGTVREPKPEKRQKGEFVPQSIESFQLPNRNWGIIIDNFNKSSEKPFPYSAVECKSIVEFVKRGTPPIHLFEAIGTSKTKFNGLKKTYNDMEALYESLYSKETLSDEEMKMFHFLHSHPLRLFMGDIDRAQGICSLVDWERFNNAAKDQPDLLMAKMKAKYRETFNDKQSDASVTTVNIQVGGNFVENM